MSKSQKNNKFPRTRPQAEEVQVDEVTLPETKVATAPVEEAKPLRQEVQVEEASMLDALAQGGEMEQLQEADNALFETVSLPEGTELPMHLQMMKEYLHEMRPGNPQNKMGDWQNRLHQALTTMLSLDPQYAIPQMRVFISWLRENRNNAMGSAYRGRHLEALKLKGHKLREYESLLHAIYTISICSTKDEFKRQIDWESLRMQFTPKNSEAYTRVLLGVCGF